MLYDLYRKQKTSPQKAMEGQFLFGIYRLEEWKGLVEAFRVFTGDPCGAESHGSKPHAA